MKMLSVAGCTFTPEPAARQRWMWAAIVGEILARNGLNFVNCKEMMGFT